MYPRGRPPLASKAQRQPQARALPSSGLPGAAPATPPQTCPRTCLLRGLAARGPPALEGVATPLAGAGQLRLESVAAGVCQKTPVF